MPDSDDGSRPQKEDSKDFVEQLRLIHFTLIVTCLALVVITLSPPPALIQKANEQLRQITEITGDGSWDIDIVSTAAANVIKGAQYYDWRLGSYGEVKCPESALAKKNIAIGGHYIAAEFPDSPYMNKSTISQPKNLEEFRKIWDTKFDAICAISLKMKGWTSNATSLFPVASEFRPADLRYPAKEEMHSPESAYFHYQASGEDELQLPEKGLGFIAFQSETIVLQAERTRSIPIDLGAELRRVSKHNWRHTEFKDAFYELDKATTGIQRLEFKDLAAVLEQQEQRTNETLEAFGIKFPAEGTIRWGILLILGIQLYFWLHVAEYRRRNFPKTDVAWIGAYPQILSRITFFATSSVAPIAIVAFLLFFQRHQTLDRFWANLVLLLSGLMAAASWHEHRRSNLTTAAPVITAVAPEARSAAQGK